MNIEQLKDLISQKTGRNVPAALSEAISELILSGDLPQGFVFPGETILCEALGISRNTLREAYKTLESSGFISRSRRGTIVNAPSAVFLSLPFSRLLEMSDFNDLMEFRSIFESETSSLAAIRATAKNLVELEYALSMMKMYAAEIDKLTEYDLKFHMEVAEASQNQLLIATMKMTQPVFINGIRQSFLSDSNGNAVREAITSHEKILKSIKNRDSVSAKHLMTDHIDSIKNRGLQISK